MTAKAVCPGCGGPMTNNLRVRLCRRCHLKEQAEQKERFAARSVAMQRLNEWEARRR
jgi:hypothetical protein